MPYRRPRSILVLSGGCLLLAWMASAAVGQTAPREEEIARLESRLTSTVPGQRLAALVRLGMLADESLSSDERNLLRQAGRIVAAATQDPDAQVRLTALRILGRLDAPTAEAAAAWLRALSDPEPGYRVAALQAAGVDISNLGNEAARTHDAHLRIRIRDRILERATHLAPVWLAGCRDLNPGVRSAAVKSVVQGTRPLLQTAPWLLDETLEPNPSDGRPLVAAYAVLAKLAEPLVGLLHDGQADEAARLTAGRGLEDVVRWYAIVTNSKLESAPQLAWPTALGEALPKVAATLQAPRACIRLQAALVLEAYGFQARPCRSALVTALADPSPFVRWTAVRALTTIGPSRDPAEEEQWHRLFVDADPDVRRAATQTWTAWERFEPPPVVHALVSSTKGEATREEGKASAVLALIQALETGDTEQRLATLKALGQLGADAALAVPALTHALASKEVAIRRAVPDVLVRIGPPARFALPALEQALRDDDREVRHAAARAVLALAPDRP